MLRNIPADEKMASLIPIQTNRELAGKQGVFFVVKRSEDVLICGKLLFRHQEGRVPADK